MARPGFIHGKLDIKILVLYLMTRVAAPIDFSTLTDLAMCDDGVDYFLYAEAVSELLDSRLLAQDGEFYHATDKGRRTCADAESSLSTVIRSRCDQRLAPLNAVLKRKAQVRSEVLPLPDGSGAATVHLALNDDQGGIFSLSLLAGSQEEGEQIAHRFSEHPDRVYNGILGVLLSDGNGSDPH